MIDNIVVDASLRLISAALDEYADWHTQVMRHVYYAEYNENLPKPEMPSSISGLRELLKTEPKLSFGEIDRIFKSADALQEMVEQALSIPGEVSVFTHAQFSDFSMFYDDMIHRLHRIERSRYLVGLGYDSVTGLRLGDVMIQDLDKEIERVARRGLSFAMVLAQLDHAADLRAQLQGDFVQLQSHIGQAISETLRTFDDAYHLDHDEFIVVLKQTDLLGSQRFVSRLREHFIEQPLMVEGKKIKLTLSFCVAEPVVGVNFPEFIDMMRRDLVRKPETENALISYEEESPLRRFVRETTGK